MRKPLSPAMLKVLEEPLMDRIPDCTGGIPRGGSLSGDVLVRALPGEVVLNRPREKVTMRGGVIRSRQLLQDPEPQPVPHPDDGLPDPGNGRPCPGDTRGGCPDEPPRPIPDPSPPRPGDGPVVV